ncbi:MAG TPA: sulfatase-like hydrolase/transferase [Opitutaceae bacterium]
MPDQPNILLITSDQQHWSTLGAVNPTLWTPSLDRLAAEGTLHTRAYCPNPTCTPSRASMITGLWPSRHGAWSLGTKLPEDVPTVGARLQEAGYRTSLIGKAHFQPLAATPGHPSIEAYPTLHDDTFWRGFHGPFYGFEHVELTRNHTDEGHAGQHYGQWLEARGCADWRRYFRPPAGTKDDSVHRWAIPEKYHYNAWIAERTAAGMDRARVEGRPFFLWASFFDPHPPYLAPEPWDTLYDWRRLQAPEIDPGEHDVNPRHHRLTQEEAPDFSAWEEQGGHRVLGFHSHRRDRERRQRDMAVYYGMVSLLDKYVGRILHHLEVSGLADNTLVVFTSDHGHLFGQHGLVAKGPFHYEDLLRVPLITRFPGRIPARRRDPRLQTLVDLPATFLACAGLEVPATMSARSQWATWADPEAPGRDCVLVENRHQPTTVHLNTLVTARYKLTVYRQGGVGELFDLQEDPGERRNLWAEPAAQEVKRQLLERMVRAEMENQPLPMPRVSIA